ncbi:MAG: hypothetical protein HW382_327 [Deltaproteobacteria bacterium]|nr:hypothetical protein [Deltaproteobacteria bacterium]
MTTDTNKNWQAIIGLVSEMKRCDECGFTTASVAMAFICIDTLASLGRPQDKQKVTRPNFKEWVDTHLKAHPDQPYQYRGKDVYAARCAFLHTYGSEAELHKEDPDTIKFAYHNGGKHKYNPTIDQGLVLIGTKSFINDVVCAVESFLKTCQSEAPLRDRVEERLPGVLQTMPLPSQ